MDAKEKSDRNSSLRWLDARSREDAIAIAVRAAARVGPLAWVWFAPARQDAELTAIEVARSIVIAGSASVSSDPAIKTAAYTAVKAAAYAANVNTDNAAFTPAYAAANAATAASANADTAYTAAKGATTNAARTAARNAKDSEFWSSIRADATALEEGRKVLQTPLWPEQPSPDLSWRAVKDAWAAAGEDWDFWIRWFDAILIGKPLLPTWEAHWAMMEQIALIAPETWDAGPAAVADAIRKIEASVAQVDEIIEKTPNAEQIIYDAKAGKLKAIPITPINEDARTHVIRSVERAVFRFRRDCQSTAGSNSRVARLECAEPYLTDLSDDVADSAGVDLALHDAINEPLRAMRRNFAEQGLENDLVAQYLFDALERCTLDVVANNDAVRVALEKRKEEAYSRIPLEEKIQLNQSCADMAADSDPWLARNMRADLALADDESADPTLRRGAVYRSISRLPRGARAINYSRFQEGVQVVETPTKKSDRKLWVATVLGPSFAAVLTKLLGG